MALYISQARRRRTAALVAAGTLVLGAGVGYVVGRSATPSVDSSVRSTIAAAGDVATELDRLPIEYDQAITGTGDSIEAGVLDPLQAVKVHLTTTLDDAPWIHSDQREAMQDAVADVELAAGDAVSAAEFAAKVTAASTLVRDSFGVTGG